MNGENATITMLLHGLKKKDKNIQMLERKGINDKKVKKVKNKAINIRTHLLLLSLLD